MEVAEQIDFEHTSCSDCGECATILHRSSKMVNKPYCNDCFMERRMNIIKRIFQSICEEEDE